MSNNFQKLIYNLSSIAPIGITFSIVWYAEAKNIKLSIFLALASLFLIIYEMFFIKIGRVKFSVVNQLFEAAENNDRWVLAYIITYILPLSGLVWEDINWTIVSCVGIIVAVVLTFSNFSIPNPVLFFAGYHFYKAKTPNGVQSFNIISKKKDYRSIQQFGEIRRVFEDLLIDGGDG